MSKETPEPGDLWQLDGEVILLIGTSQGYLSNVVLNDPTEDSEHDYYVGSFEGELLIIALRDEGQYIGTLHPFVDKIKEHVNGNS